MEILEQARQLGLGWGRADGITVTRAAVVAEARSWLGERWVHQHETRGVGVDCGGLVRGVSLALGLLPQDYRQRMPPDLAGYSRTPDGNLGELLCDFYWRRIAVAAMQPGDVVLMRFAQHPQHTAILGDYRHGGLSMIHSLAGKGVCEHRLDETWRRRIVAAYALPGVS